MKTLLKTFILLLLAANTSTAQNINPTIKTTKINENLYEFFVYINNNSSVNIYAFVGSDGVLMVDTGYRGTTDLVKGELSRITDKKVKYIINTHYNGDHTGGNAALGIGAIIVAHQATRSVLLQTPNYLAAGLPAVTFQDSLKLYIDGEEIDLKYFPGHTSSDIIVHFRNSNMVFIGDLAFSDTFPLVQPDGSYYQLEKSISQLSTMFREDTRIFPSHGHEVVRKDLCAYLDMMEKTKATVFNAIKEGKMPDEAKKDNILKDWRAWDSKLLSTINAERWIDNLYGTLDEGKELSAIIVLRREYQKSGLNAMIEMYRKVSSQKMKTLFFIENDFNNWGYELIAAHKLQDAIEVFKINTEIFPEAWNTFDSLGESYAAIGDKKNAIENYEKSLKLNPNSQSGKEALKQLRGN